MRISCILFLGYVCKFKVSLVNSKVLVIFGYICCFEEDLWSVFVYRYMSIGSCIVFFFFGVWILCVGFD